VGPKSILSLVEEVQDVQDVLLGVLDCRSDMHACP